MDKIVTIGREFGSGGRETGIRLAQKLGIPFYDKELISLAAKEGGLDKNFVEAHEEQAPALLTPNFGRQDFSSFMYQPSYSDTIFFRQCDVLKQIAEKGPCVIVGRCADYVLRSYGTVNIFIYSDMESKILRKRAMAPEKAAYTDEEMAKWIANVNKGRKKYYEHYSGKRWGDVENYDLCVSTTRTGVDGAVATIMMFLENFK